MTMLRNLFHRVGGGTNARFERYYGDVARPGVGYPTADEARKDMQQAPPHHQSVRLGALCLPDAPRSGGPALSPLVLISLRIQTGGVLILLFRLPSLYNLPHGQHPATPHSHPGCLPDAQP